MNLSSALEAYGTPEFEEVLASEIEQNAHDLPLEERMDHGGGMGETTEVGVDEIKDDGETITAKLDVYFEEDHPSGCADITRTDSYRATLTMRLDKETGDAEFDVVKSRNTTNDDRDEEDMDFDERADHDYDNSEF